MKSIQASDIDEYIAGFSPEIQRMLQQLRTTIRKAAPEAKEAIKYAMPTFVLHGNLVHFAAFKHHIGFYPAPHAIVSFKKELSRYKGSKGAVQFPLDAPLPLGLVTKIVRYRVKQDKEKNKARIKGLG